MAWPSAAQTAFTHGASIWADLINSREDIVVEACWKSLGTGVLGSAGPQLTANFTGAPIFSTWYPFGLADAITGVNNNSNAWDIRANFNDDFTNWYFGTDGVTPIGQYDFVTVVLHEIGHGLGFSGGASYSGGTGTLDLAFGFPTIYSRFIKDGTGTELWDGYTQGTAALGNALLGQVGGVFFHGSSAISANGGPVKLYSPSVWANGSSFSHLDEVFNGTPSDLMTFSVGSGVSNHAPGPVAMGLLKDIGWPNDNDDVMTRSLGSLAYSPTPDNLPFDARGTLTINFNFAHTGSDDVRHFYVKVNTANLATLNNATTTDNNGGVDSILAIANTDLPGGDSLFSNGETLTVPLAIDIAAGGQWGLNFDVFASDDVSAAKVLPRKVASFTIDSSTAASAGFTLTPTGLVEVSTVSSEENVLSGRVGPTMHILLFLALLGFSRRRYIQS